VCGKNRSTNSETQSALGAREESPALQRWVGGLLRLEPLHRDPRQALPLRLLGRLRGGTKPCRLKPARELNKAAMTPTWGPLCSASLSMPSPYEAHASSPACGTEEDSPAWSAFSWRGMRGGVIFAAEPLHRGPRQALPPRLLGWLRGGTKRWRRAILGVESVLEHAATESRLRDGRG